jgi:signal transduction histidine kinase
MQVSAQPDQIDGLRRDLILILVASLAIVVVLTIVLVDNVGLGQSSLSALNVMLATFVLGACGSAIAYGAYRLTAARRSLASARAEATALRRSLLISEAVINAEPQIMIYWEQGRGLQILTSTLTSVPGLPLNQAELLHFGAWLEPSAADDLKAGLDNLFGNGQPFNLLLRTSQGGHIEADGRAAGTRAVVRLRDLVGQKRDLMKILDRQRQLSRDIGFSRALLDALPIPVWLRGQDGRIEWSNAAYVKAVEAESGAQVVERQLELLESRQRTELEASLQRGGGAASTPVAKRLQLIIGGERRPHDVVVTTIGGQVATAAFDVASLSRAETELARLTAATDRTLDRVATGVAIFNRDQKLSFFNDAYVRLCKLDAAWLDAGPSNGEILDRLREQSSLPAVVDYRNWKKTLLDIYKTGVEIEDWWHLPDGRTFHIVVEQRSDGGVTYLLDDATERFALESRYNALIDVQRETLDSLKEGVAVFGTDGRLKLSNSSFVQIWKLNRRTLEEAPHIDEIIRHARQLYDDPATWQRIARVATALLDERDAVEGQMVRPDQTVVDYAATPLPDGATLVTFADVTDAKRYERALIERNEALVAADRLKSQFISHVSYELRTPLTNIIGFGELLDSPRTGPLNDKQREYLHDISGSSKTLLAIIDDILDLATIDAGGLELKLSPVDVREAIDAAIRGVRERAGRARLTLDIAVSDDAQTFVGDESRVRQVLYNLLSNAVGFSRPGDTIHVSCWREKGMMVFTVEDQGVGIPKEQQARVFERFESHSHGSKHRGAGLGLSVVKSLVDLHGGDMTLDSEPGRGTRVTVRFPELGTVRATVEGLAKRA